MLSKEELQIIIERDGISEFFNVIDCFYLEEAECTIYELETDYYAAVFRIFPSAYAGPGLEEIISSALSCGLPENSAVQFHQISSKNIEDDKERYNEQIVEELDELKLGNPQMLKELHNAHMEFLDKHVETTVFEKTKLAYYLRDFTNTATVMIPASTKGNPLAIDDLISHINKFKGTMYNVFPININEHQYIRIMRELLVPYNPLRNTFREEGVNIRDHFTDIDSSLTVLDKGVIRLSPTEEIDFKSQIEVFRGKSNKTKNLLERTVIYFKNLLGMKEEDASLKEQSHNLTENKKDAHSKAKYVKVLSKKEFPPYADLNSITDISMDYFNMNVQQQIPLPYVITATVKIHDTTTIVNEVKESSMWNKWQLDNAGRLAEYFPVMTRRAYEADRVLNDIEHGQVPTKVSWSMLLYADDVDTLEYYTSVVKSVYQKKGFVLQEEDLLAAVVFFYSMIMKYDDIYEGWSRRFQTIYISNVASIVPVGTDSRGFGSNPIVQLFGRNGQPQSFDLYDKNAANKNAVIVAPSGAGKSFFTQRLVWSYLKQGAKIRIIDNGRSYFELCNLLGGQYITFPDDADICLNPFTEARVNKNGDIEEDEVSNITNLIGIMAGYDLGLNDSHADAEIVNAVSAYISRAVVNAFESEGNNAGMKDVGHALKQELKHLKENARVEGDIRDGDIDRRLPGIINTLAEFTNPNGIYYKFVNGKANITFNSNLVILDMEELETKQKRFKDFIIATVTNAVEREFYKERYIDQRKLFFIDEAMSLLDGKAGTVILQLYQRARKMKGSIITITQSINHFFLNDSIKGIFENAYWRLFLEQDATAIATALDEKKLIIDEYAFNLLQTVKTKVGEYSEVMIMTKVGDLMIGRTLATSVEYWVSVQEEEKVRYVEQVKNAYNIDGITARLAIGFSEMKDTTIENELLRLSGYEDSAIDELLETEI